MAVHCNDLDGKAWLKYSISLWSDIQKNQEEKALAKIHPALFPQALASRLIEMFSHQGDTVLDPFCGIGSSILAAQTLGRTGIGIELSSVFADKADERCHQKMLFPLETSGHPGTIFQGNALDLTDYVEDESVNLCVTSPPYWDILLRKRVVDHKETRHYGETEGDLGHHEEYDAFLHALECVFKQVFQVLKPGGYCCVNVMDLRKKQQFYPLHSDLSLIMQDSGYQFCDVIIWDRRQEYNSLGPIGYPVVFLMNKVHEYILIFRKPL